MCEPACLIHTNCVQALTAAVESSLLAAKGRGQALQQRCQSFEAALIALLQHQKLHEELQGLGAAAAACEGTVREVELLAQVGMRTGSPEGDGHSGGDGYH